jgi:hypothetical protein
MRGRGHALDIGMDTTFTIGVVSRVFVIEVGELQVVIDAAIDKVTEGRNGVCYFEDPDTGPELLGLIDGESWLGLD